MPDATPSSPPAPEPSSTPAAEHRVPPPDRADAVVTQLLLGSEGGGIVTAIRHWAPALIEAGWRLEFILLAEDKAASMLRDAGLSAEVVEVGKVGRFTRLPARLADRGTSIIHVHNPSAHLVGDRAARKIGARLMRTVHADMLEEMRGSLPGWKIALWKALMSRALRSADCTASVSPHLVDRLPGMDSSWRDDVVVLPNGYDPGAIERDTHDLPEGLDPWLGDRPMILSMGRLVAVKNYARLLEAFARVVESVPEARLVLAGSGPQREMLESRRDELGLGASVRMHSWVDHVAPLLRRADVVAISSRSECCPMLVLEAMATETPLVATAVGGIPHMVDDGETGRLVPSDDAAALGAAIVEILGRADRGAALGRAGRSALDRRFHHRVAARRHAEIYNTLLGR